MKATCMECGAEFVEGEVESMKAALREHIEQEHAEKGSNNDG